MKGARPADNKQPVIALFNDIYRRFAAAKDSGERSGRCRELRGKELRRDKGIIAEDCVSC